MIKPGRCRGIKCVQMESIYTSGPTLRRFAETPLYLSRSDAVKSARSVPDMLNNGTQKEIPCRAGNKNRSRGPAPALSHDRNPRWNSGPKFTDATMMTCCRTEHRSRL